jgi:hypothetical protein
MHLSRPQHAFLHQSLAILTYFLACIALHPLTLTLIFIAVVWLCLFVDWFKAGKGPDPALASLDRDMDAYFKTKAAAGSAPDSTLDAAAASMVVVTETAAATA